jgi:hypothetical protein
MILRFFAFIILITTSSELRAQAVSLDGFVPVAFTNFVSSMPDEKASMVVESLTKNLRMTFIDVYSTEMIGSTSEFSPTLAPAVLGSSGYAVGEMDRTIDLVVMPEIKPVLNSLNHGEEIVINMELMWADSAILEKFPNASMAPSALVAAMRLSGRQDVASLLAMRWLDVNDNDPDGSLRASLRSTEMRDRIALANKGQWLPWTTMITVVIDNQGIRIDQSSLVIPAGFYKANRIEKPGVLIERVTYAPLHSPFQPNGDRAGSDMANIKFKRHYSATDKVEESELRLSFGQWKNNAFNTVESSKCVTMVEQIPTIHGRVVFSESTWWGSVVGWIRSWFVSEIDTKILLQDLSITYDRDNHRLIVNPAKSVIPIIVYSNDVFSGGKPYVLDPRAGVFGINLYERFVGSQIADGLSADLNRTLSEADAALSETIMGIAGAIVQ